MGPAAKPIKRNSPLNNLLHQIRYKGKCHKVNFVKPTKLPGAVREFFLVICKDPRAGYRYSIEIARTDNCPHKADALSYNFKETNKLSDTVVMRRETRVLQGSP